MSARESVAPEGKEKASDISNELESEGKATVVDEEQIVRLGACDADGDDSLGLDKDQLVAFSNRITGAVTGAGIDHDEGGW